MKVGIDTLKHVGYNILKKEYRIIPWIRRIQEEFQRVSFAPENNLGKASSSPNSDQTFGI